MILSKKDLGQLIKSARKLKSKEINKLYTQKMLANDIHRSQSHIGDIESGRSYPSYSILNKIAVACNVPMSFFESDDIDASINQFIEFQLKGISDSDAYELKEALKKDPHLDLNYITRILHNNETTFETPDKILRVLLKQPSFINFCGIDFNKLNDDQSSKLVNELLESIKVISSKYKLK